LDCTAAWRNQGVSLVWGFIDFAKEIQGRLDLYARTLLTFGTSLLLVGSNGNPYKETAEEEIS
jgi:hypothetical protein